MPARQKKPAKQWEQKSHCRRCSKRLRPAEPGELEDPERAEEPKGRHASPGRVPPPPPPASQRASQPTSRLNISSSARIGEPHFSSSPSAADMDVNKRRSHKVEPLAPTTAIDSSAAAQLEKLLSLSRGFFARAENSIYSLQRQRQHSSHQSGIGSDQTTGAASTHI